MNIEKLEKYLDEEIAEAQKERDDIRWGDFHKGVFNGKVIAFKDARVFLKKIVVEAKK